MKKREQRKISFVLFVAAVFFAGLVLVEYSSSVWMVVAAGVVLVAASCFFIWEREAKEQTASGKTSEILFADRMAEWMRSNEKAEKGVSIAVKKQQEAMTEGLAALGEKLSDVIKVQENTMKTLILYNKENARQVALSEREELRRLSQELQEAVQAGFDTVTGQMQNAESVKSAMGSETDAVKETMQQIYDELHTSGEAMASGLAAASGDLREIRELLRVMGESVRTLTKLVEAMETLPAAAPKQSAAHEPEVIAETETMETGTAEAKPEVIAEAEIMEAEPEAVAEPEVIAEAETMEAEIVEPEPEPAPAVPEVDLSDPNKAMSADDIAALFAAMGNAEPEAVAEEPEAVAEPKPEPAPAVPEVDFSDPNKAMSADDIAALFAAMGNAEPETVAEEPEAVAEPKPEPAPAVPEVDLSDPNKAMSADDIAALFAAMGNAEPEAVAEEPEAVAEPKPEPAPAVPEVDLSDPNKAMSADDIAALFAAMGN